MQKHTVVPAGGSGKKATKRTPVFGGNLPRILQPYRFFFGVFRARGTVLVRAIPQVLIAMGMAGLWRFIYSEKFEYAIPKNSFSGMAFATAFLVVFRSNLAYSRYYEGRKLLGALVHHLSRLVRVCAAETNLQGHVDLKEVARKANVLMAFIRQDLRESRNPPNAHTAVVGAGRDKSWKAHFGPGGGAAGAPPYWITHDDHGAPPIGSLLRQDEIDYYTTVNAHGRVVGATSELMGELTRNVDDSVTVAGFVGIIDTVTGNWRGACRIIDTPMPFSYAHMLHLILLLFTLVAVPLVFAEGLEGYLMIPAAGIVALIFYGINELASEIENPFGWQENDHNLSRFCKGLFKETEMLTAWHDARGGAVAGGGGGGGGAPPRSPRAGGAMEAMLSQARAQQHTPIMGQVGTGEIVTLYADGFTINDGPLRASGDHGANDAFLSDIANGVSPAELTTATGQAKPVALVDKRGVAYASQ